MYKRSPSGHVLGLVTLLRLLVEHFAGRTALFPGGDAVEAHVELLTVVWVREHGVGHVLATAVVHLIFGAREAVFQFHYTIQRYVKLWARTITTPLQAPSPGGLGFGGVHKNVVVVKKLKYFVGAVLLSSDSLQPVLPAVAGQAHDPAYSSKCNPLGHTISVPSPSMQL